VHPALQRTAHRPWPLPEGPWSWRQSWCDLLFAHWPVDARRLRPLVPPPLTLQEFDGTAWLGVVPFRMEGVMRRPLPDVPGMSAFPELNVRTYVEHRGRAGVWFLSLDATNPVAVWAARRFFHLPYHRARIEVAAAGPQVRYVCRRASDPDVGFAAEYEPRSEPYAAGAGSLEHFLTERYCLFAQTKAGRLSRTDVHHAPWPLQRARAVIRANTMAQPYELTLAEPPAQLPVARRLAVVVWPPDHAPETAYKPMA
jgi:uncharacterized protein YqjF (DUF2071 family)